MPTSYTSLIGLALPVTGELSGTWGDVVNNYITNYLDSAVAGTQTISGSQTAVTLSVTNGSSLVTAGSGATGSAQFQIINCTGNPAGLLTITAPASSRQYIIINSTSTSQSVKIVGTGPTTGVTLISGEKAHVAWNGSDFVKIATTAAAGGSNTQVQYNSSGVLAGSSNLTFDGTNLTVGGTASATKLIPTGGAITGNGMYLPAANSVAITTNGAQAIYIDSSQNVGVGVTPSAWYVGSGTSKAIQFNASSALYDFSASGNRQTQLLNNAYLNTSANFIYLNTDAASRYMQNAGIHSWYTAPSGTAGTAISFTQAMTLDASGNLGLGTTLAAWGSGAGMKAIQMGGTSFSFLAGNWVQYIYGNAYYDGTNNRYIANGPACSYGVNVNGQFQWNQAASGTAGNTISFTQAMTLDSSGNLGIGTTSPGGYRLAVVGTANITNGASQTFRTGMLIEGGGSASGDLSPALQFSSSNINAAIYSERLSSYGGNLIFATQGTSVGNPTERARIDYSGNLGLGATSITNCRFQIKGANNTTNAYADGVKATSNNETVSIQYSWAGINASSDLIFATGGTERARITSGGAFLFNTTSTTSAGVNTASFQVKNELIGVGSLAGIFWENRSGGVTSTTNWYGWYTTSGTIYIYNGSANIASINASTGAYTALSDKNKKKDFEPSTIGLDAVVKLKPTLFRMRDDADDAPKQLGFIAQDVAEVIPQAYVEQRVQDAGNKESVYIGLDDRPIIATLVKAVQELKAEIDSLKAQLKGA